MAKAEPAMILSAPIVPTLRKMTIPMIFGMIFLMLFNLVDTFFISMLGTEPLAAISFTFPVTFTLISLAIGLGIGTSAVIATALGSGQQSQARFDGAVALMVSAFLVTILALVGYFCSDPIFLLLGAEPQLLPLIDEYMQVWFLASVLLVTPMIGNAVLRANGDTKTPSLIMGASGLVNAVLDPILIFGFGPIEAMGVRGAAIASAISWLIGVAAILYILIVHRQLIDIRCRTQSFVVATRKILKIGLPAAGANMLTPLAMAVMTAIVAHFGAPAVAAFGVGSRIESIASLVVLALSMTLPPFISQNFGAGNKDRVEQAYKQTLKFVMFWQFAIYLLLIVVAPWIASAFATEAQVRELIKLFIYILPLTYGLQGVIILTNSSFNALHKPMHALVLSVVRLFVFYVPIAYLGSLIGDLTGLFIGAAVGNLLTAIVAYLWFSRELERQSV
ncbi:MATE family efflux transporter [Pseudoalteromonas sp. YIC-827]|uniref:MATE family efflux transporter n=1 Tax=Pseudoalteromonas qingdaonensis TaxID=3131913 RepID=A0ABU9MX91_9GAMM